MGSLAPRMVTVSLAVCSANPESSEYHRSHHQTTVHAYYILDVYSNQVCFKVKKRERVREREREKKRKLGGRIAQLLECWTEKPDTIWTWFQLSGPGRDFYSQVS